MSIVVVCVAPQQSVPFQVATLSTVVFVEVLSFNMGREQLREPEESMLEHEETTQQAQAQASDAPASLIQQATAILLQPDPQSKAHQTHDVAELWRQEQLPAGNTGSVQLPDRPGRDDNKVSQLESLLHMLCIRLCLHSRQTTVCVARSSLAEDSQTASHPSTGWHSCRSRWWHLARYLGLAKGAAWRQGKPYCTAWCTLSPGQST